MARQTRKVREARAILVANKQLEKRLDHINWEEDVLYPALEKVANGELQVSYDPEPRALGAAK